MSLELNKEHFEENRQEFEAWLRTLKRPPNDAIWKPTHNRYTVLSYTQSLFECWNAARGIDYRWVHILDDALPDETEGTLYDTN